MIFLIENQFNIFLRENALWIALSFALIIIAVLLLIFLTSKKESQKTTKAAFDATAFLQALGGRQNVISLSFKGSRLILVIKEKNLLKEEDLKAQGVLSIIKMASKITLVVSDSAEHIAKELKID